jgi:purine-binding chemotaxis protein CheW
MGTITSPSRPVEILTLALSGEIFAIEAVIVNEILDPVPVTNVPNAALHATGMINVRGKVVPLVDLRVLFGMKQQSSTIDTRFVVIEIKIEGVDVIIGILADKVYEVTQIDMQSIETTPRVGISWPQEYIRGIGRRNGDFLIVLDINRVFAAENAGEDRFNAL